MRFSLQDMVRQTLAESDRRVKLAMEGATEPESKKKDGPPANPQTPAENAGTAPERNEETPAEKTSSVFVEKLASALEYCNEHFLKEAVGQPESIGPGKGTGALATNLTSPPGPGKQSEETGQATHNQPPKNPGSDVKSPGQVNPSTAMATDMNDRPGGSEDWSGTDKMKQAQIQRILGIMKKAENAINPAHIGAKTTNPHQDSPPGAAPSGENVPKLPGEAKKQENLVTSVDKAINYTKQDAKAVPKARMGEVLSEPAQKKSTDPVLHNNLDAASSAGVKLSSMKVAAARALLLKVAEEGAKPDASPEEREKAEKLKSMLQAKQDEKEKASMGMPIGGGY